MILKCKSFGLLTNTEVKDWQGRVLVTNGLDIQSLVNLWRWYYKVSFWEKIELQVSEDLYKSMMSKPLCKWCRSVEELFYDNGVVVKEIVNERV